MVRVTVFADVLDDGAQLAVGRAQHVVHFLQLGVDEAVELALEELLQFGAGVLAEALLGLQAHHQPAGFGPGKGLRMLSSQKASSSCNNGCFPR